MCLGYNPENRVLGIQGGLEHHAPLPSTQEAGEDQEGIQECENSRPHNSQKAGTPDRPAYLYNPSSTTSTTTLYQALQCLKGKALRNSRHNYNTVISQDKDAVKDLDWWIVHASRYNGKPKAERIIESNASTTGLGASCQGVQTGGPWDQREAQMHINWLELKAAFLALETFAANWTNLHVQLLLDNRTAIGLPYSLELTPPSSISPPLLFAKICCRGIFISNLSPLDHKLSSVPF